jgi:hypothetical protein
MLCFGSTAFNRSSLTLELTSRTLDNITGSSWFCLGSLAVLCSWPKDPETVAIRRSVDNGGPTKRAISGSFVNDNGLLVHNIAAKI